MPMIAGQYVPGPNDHHAKVETVEGKEVVSLHPGLGKDEPSPEKARDMYAKSAERQAAIKAQLEKETKELEAKELAIDAKEAKLKAKMAALGITEEELEAETGG